MQPTTQRSWSPRVRCVVALVVLAGAQAACDNSSDAAPTTSAPVATSASAPSTTSPPDTSEPDTSDPTTVDPGYRASITRTAHGVAHIVADDWGSLGFGQGYAFAQDRACTLIDQVIKVRGQRAQWFGAGDGDANVLSDLAYRHLRIHAAADERWAGQPAHLSDFVSGYVNGFNSELEEEGPSGWCEGEPWVQPITLTDLYAYMTDAVLYASSGVLLGPIANAQPPPPGTAPPSTPAPDPAPDPAPETSTTLLVDSQGGSNGWAIGRDGSASGGGMLLANPHFPWEGEKRLWESQLTLTTGEMDAYGVTLSGIPGILIGFNDAVAWTHTVSAGYRLTLYELSLVPGDPTSYVYGDQTRAMTSTDITVDVLQADGSIQPLTRTMWSSHYGPMLELPFGWTADKAYTYRDANIDNSSLLQQFFGMITANDMDEFIAAHATSNAMPWVNTIATSADGRAWYADTAATPNLSPDALAGWQASVDAGGLAAVVLDNGAILLDGSNPVNEWVDDAGASRPGIVPFARQPQLERSDYVFNANDSHWLANPSEPLTGFSPLTGPEAVPQSARTRMNVVLLTDPAMRGQDGLFDLDEMQAAILSQRGVHAELLIDDVLRACDRTPLVLVDEVPYLITPACEVLRVWDRTYHVDSRGAALWREYLSLFSRADLVDAGPLYRTPFDPGDPINTPNGLNDAVDVEVLQNLGIAAKHMLQDGWALDVPLGQMQRDGRAGDSGIPMGGGNEIDGTASVVGCCSGSNTLAPTGDPGTFSPTQSYSDRGYPVTNGNSFMMVMAFTTEGPSARAVLTYGQPDDPADPDFTSQTRVYSDNTFRPVLFTRQQIAADPDAVTYEVRGAKPPPGG